MDAIVDCAGLLIVRLYKPTDDRVTAEGYWVQDLRVNNKRIISD